MAGRPDGGGGGGDLLAEVRHTAELLWTSNLRFEWMGDHAKEFCSMLNGAIRTDDPELMYSTAALASTINVMCVKGRNAMAKLPFPQGGTCYRGGGFDDRHKSFFTKGKKFRQPSFLATSFSRPVATRFMQRAKDAGRQRVMWVVQLDPAGERDDTKRCKHVNFVQHSLVPGELEYLFAAYSIFTVVQVNWSAGGIHRIELNAATDNSPESEGGKGPWATPVGSENLPLAPWS